MNKINLNDVFKDIEGMDNEGLSNCYTGIYLEEYDAQNIPETLAKLITKTPKVKIDKDNKGIN